MPVLIDASILIEAERERLDLEPHVARHGDEEAFLSVVTASEQAHRAERREVDCGREAHIRPKAYAVHRTLLHSICRVGPSCRKQNPTCFNACTVTVE
jgi:predicted nucleic acid-binding protein